MREKIFKRLLAAAEKHEPLSVRWAETKALRRLAARSFGIRGRPPLLPERVQGHTIEDTSRKSALQRYAEFTVSCMETRGADRERLYRDAYCLGSGIRRVTGFRERGDIDRLIRYLYRNINIDMTGSTGDELIVHDCYFSRYYTPEQCSVMSEVDSGIIAGICGGGHMIFTERITEGCGRCRACLIGGTENE